VTGWIGLGFCRCYSHGRHELTLQMRLELSNDYHVEGLLVSGLDGGDLLGIFFFGEVGYDDG
jgi:hypothetical protein